jgi:hypothetical protein
MRKNHKINRQCKALAYTAIFISIALTAESTIPALAAGNETTYEEYKSGSVHTSPESEDGYTVIEISDEEALAALAENCKYDMWSADKCVVLTADIALSSNTDISIPVFGGIFDGNGHSITNLNITDSGSAIGLFRYIQDSGIVRNLSVEGNVTPDGSKSQTGGIAGVNYGQIINVNFSGQVSGDSDVGGIVGVNEETGQIRRCSSDAAVSGNHSTGGIAGNNHGIINNCSNTGDINIHNTDVSYDIENISVENFEDINSTSNVSAYTDTGGVAGLSDGKIYFCTNEGTIGYSHVGYNVGGIVGRLHQGYIQNCTNKGTVYGRKDVAGIAGQMEPFLQVEYLADTLDEIGTQSDVFLNMLEKSQKDLNLYIDNAADLSRNLTESLGNASDAGNSALNSTNDAFYVYNQELGNIADSGKKMADSISSDSQTGKSVSMGDYSVEVPTDTEAYKTAIGKFGTEVSASVGDASGQVNDISGSVRDSLSDMNSSMSSAENYLNALIDTLDNGNSEVGDDMLALINQAKYLRSLIGSLRTDLFEYEGLSVEDVSDEEAGSETPEIVNASEADEALYDTTSFRQGKITLCENRGMIEADTNVGGIVGQVATEYDLDPEDDIELTGEESLNIEQTVKAVIRESRNYGKIKSKKDYVGGIVGKADFGATISCESYGDIESSGGSYVGGIAGSSSYAIRSCYSMGTLSGKSYIGGIAGMGCDIFYSYAYNDFDTTGECIGAIAGMVKNDGTLYGNYYVEGKPGGVDNIGYESGAEPISYEEFSNIDNLPENFRVFKVVFKADDEVVETYELSYGASVDEDMIPAIPDKEGCYGTWPTEGLDFITGNMIIEAQYEKWISALKSDDTDEEGRAILLVSGSFLPEYKLVTQIDEALNGDITGDITFDITDNESGVSVYGSEASEKVTDTLEVRVLCDNPDKTLCLVKNADGTYTATQTTVIGSYLSFSADGPCTFKLQKATNSSMLIKLCVLLCLALALVVLVIIVSHAKRRRKKLEEQKAVKEAEVISEDDAENI